MIKSYENVPTDLGDATITIDDSPEGMTTIFILRAEKYFEIPTSLIKVLNTQIEDNKEYGSPSER